MLTNVDIETLSKKMNIPLALCGFKDELPKKLQANKYYCINLEDEQDPETKEMNGGSHWVGFQIRELQGLGKTEAVYFDSYGMPPPKIVKKLVKDTFDISVWHPTKDIQSIVNEACGYYQLAWAHYVNDDRFKTKSLKDDTNKFLEYFNDLNKCTDYKKNEFVLKHFFLAKDPSLRKKIEVDNPLITKN